MQHNNGRCRGDSATRSTPAALLLCLVVAVSKASDIYVSPSGSDTDGDGTQTKPFATLPKAQIAARKALAATESNDAVGSDVTVHLGPGKYYQPEPLVLTALDSGRKGGRMKWIGPGPSAGIDPAKAAVVHGGVAVPATGWKRTTPDSPIWSINVSALASAPSTPSPRPPPLPPPPPPPPPGPPPVANITYAHCGTVEVGVAYNGNDIAEMMTGSIDSCCKACAAHAGCKAWSYCNLPTGQRCGTKNKPVDCYIKTAASHATAMAARVSGSPGDGCNPHYMPLPPPPPPPNNNWRFFNLLENGEAATLARLPDYGSGYLKDLGCKNSDTSFTCPPGVLPAAMDAADIGVQCNLGADWFTSLRQGVSYNAAENEVTFQAKQSGFSANDKIYVQGDKALISEPGEWALESGTGMLYLWPRDETAMAAGTADIVVATTTRVFDFQGTDWEQGLTTAIDVDGIVFSGSDFASEFILFRRGNDTPLSMREGMIRFENATDISVKNCALLDAGFSAFWLQGKSQKITVEGNRIERPGFCGAYLQGIYPGDTWAGGDGDGTQGTVDGTPAWGPIKSSAEAYVNHGHSFSNNAIFDYGKRVGHGSGFWFFQAGNTTVSHNQIVEGPRDAFGVYGQRFGCFGPKGAGSLTCGADCNHAGVVKKIYGEPCDFWCGLRALTTQWIEISYNKVANVVRDTSDAGALEYWGVGAFNTAHHNCFSDMDPGLLQGGWLNFLFQDDAAHYLNHSSNILMEVKAAGSQEAGMMKSIGSVFENNIVVDSVVGHVYQLTPYIEPAANMVYSNNIFSNLTTTGADFVNGTTPPPPPAGQPPPPPSPAAELDNVIRFNSSQTLAGNGTTAPCGLAPYHGYGFEKGAPPDFPPLSVDDKIMKLLDYNTYFGVQGHNLKGTPCTDPAHFTCPNNESMAGNGWDLHASEKDPLFMRSKESIAHPWNRSCTDYKPAPDSPVHALGFREIDAENIGLTDQFLWDRSQLNLKSMRGGRKLQAEGYNRMRGLWRTGSSWIGGADGQSSAAHYPFSEQAWARYDNVWADCAPTHGRHCTLQLKFRSPKKTDSFSPPDGPRKLSVTMNAPAFSSEAVTIASTTAGVRSVNWTLLNLTVNTATHSSFSGETIFLNLDGELFVDWLRFIRAED